MNQMSNQNPEAEEAAPLIEKLATYLQQEIGSARALSMEMYTSKALLDAEHEHITRCMESTSGTLRAPRNDP